MKFTLNMVGQPRGAAKRLSFLFVMAMVICLYFLYAVSTFLVMREMRTLLYPHVMNAVHELPQSDFARFWFVGKSIFIKRAADFGYYIPESGWFKSTFQINILSIGNAPKLIWLYPPTMNLLAILFSFIPLAPSFWLWRIFSLLVASYLLRQAKLEWFTIIAGLLSPAALHDMAGGQNGVLTAGLLVSALLLLDTKPRLAGSLAGMLCIKPQLAFALPIILFQRTRLKALISCLIAALFLVVISFIVEGLQPWIFFIEYSQRISRQIISTPFKEIFPAGGFTVFMMARSLNATIQLAWFVQISSSMLSIFLIWLVWRRATDDNIRRMAITICLMTLLTPYGFIYDLTAFSIAMAAVFFRASDGRKIIFAILWLLSGYCGTLANMTGLILMPVASLAGVLACWNDKQKFNQNPLA